MMCIMLQQSNSQSWPPNLVILVTLSLPGVGREGGGDNAMFDGFLSPVRRLAPLYLATGYS